MPFCKKCGMGVDPDSTSCKYCGASQVPAQPLIDPTLLAIVLVDIVVLTLIGLWSGSLTWHILVTIAIVANVGIFGADLVLRRAGILTRRS